MQNQILGFFIVTSIALGGLCGVQWHQGRQHRQQAAALHVKLEDNAIQMDGLQSDLRALQSDLQQLKSGQTTLTGLVAKLTLATNALAREVEAARSEAASAWPVSNDPVRRACAAVIRSHWAENPGALDLMQGQQSWLLNAMSGVLARDATLPPEERARLSQLLAEDQMNRIRARLQAAHHPLLDEQEPRLQEALTQVESQEAPPAAAVAAKAGPEELSLPARLEKHLEVQEMENQALLDRARSFLNADQLEALASFQTNHVHLQRLGLALLRETRRASAAGAAY